MEGRCFALLYRLARERESVLKREYRNAYVVFDRGGVIPWENSAEYYYRSFNSCFFKLKSLFDARNAEKIAFAAEKAAYLNRSMAVGVRLYDREQLNAIGQLGSNVFIVVFDCVEVYRRISSVPCHNIASARLTVLMPFSANALFSALTKSSAFSPSP